MVGISRPLYPLGLLSLAVAAGAATPAGDAPGALIWSTTAGGPLMWDGSKWVFVPVEYPPTSVAAVTYTVGLKDTAIIFSVACTVTLPAAATFPGRQIMVKNIAAFAVTSASSNVKPIGTNTAATAILAATAGKWALLVSDGANWIVMMAN